MIAGNPTVILIIRIAARIQQRRDEADRAPIDRIFQRVPEAEFKRHAFVEPARRAAQGFAKAIEVTGLERVVDRLEQTMALASIFRDFQHHRDPEGEVNGV
ncbi:hypothetical protein NKH55_18395 [Mesorhizobium opportunistum]|uniref:hypothetical protein n=1 Tax=Mesorhizobium opportunistum TaxID=593909 RepID=UPI003337CDE7